MASPPKPLCGPSMASAYPSMLPMTSPRLQSMILRAPCSRIDIAKNVFQVHGVDDKDRVVIRKRLRRPDILRFFASLPPCLIGIEACSASHHWARELIRLGH